MDNVIAPVEKFLKKTRDEDVQPKPYAGMQAFSKDAYVNTMQNDGELKFSCSLHRIDLVPFPDVSHMLQPTNFHAVHVCFVAFLFLLWGLELGVQDSRCWFMFQFEKIGVWGWRLRFRFTASGVTVLGFWAYGFVLARPMFAERSRGKV